MSAQDTAPMTPSTDQILAVGGSAATFVWGVWKWLQTRKTTHEELLIENAFDVVKGLREELERSRVDLERERVITDRQVVTIDALRITLGNERAQMFELQQQCSEHRATIAHLQHQINGTQPPGGT